MKTATRDKAHRAAAAPPAHPADASARSRGVLEALLRLLPKHWRPATRDYLVLMRMDRPIGALLLLWPTWWALWLAADDFPPPHLLVIFTLGVFLMRAAGCVINDYADRWLDPQVERTRGRPIAAGRITPRAALVLFGVLMVLAFGLVLLTNAMTVKLSLAGAALATLYPFAKRYTHLPQVVLGAAFGWSIPMAFAAVNGGAPMTTWFQALPPLCWLLFLANVVWATVYDTEYAMVDRDEDIAAGSKSTAILFGDDDRIIIGVLMGTFVLALLMVGTRAGLHWTYYLGVGAATGCCIWQQYLIRERERAACFAAFRNNLWLGMAVWASICLALALQHS
ncbi:4-hydroxybenzoate octaprenyltransferase [Tahibacter sp.]|uniref:4-hydroxybenzoate octaprenyltransferase n=1 Tax=Tahibacter sp. TaxID=2056211 RepID=UPI0028C487EF|nr:4-hydroxybenzoate octaprenyltransferase [Tahibacter sp.]